MSAQTPPTSATALGCPNASSVGTSAACILVTILAANLAATRTEASLPYLVQGVPLALRFADQTPTLPPFPVRPAANGPNPKHGNTADSTAPPIPEGTSVATHSSSANPTPDTPTDTSRPSSSTPNSSPSTGVISDEGVVILPDTYAPRPMVRIDDLLPFFVPPAAPPSRARYELK